MATKLDSSPGFEKPDQDRLDRSSDVSNPEDSEGVIVDGIDERSLLRKLDRNLLPAVGILYLLSFLDRSNGSLPTDTIHNRTPTVD